MGTIARCRSWRLESAFSFFYFLLLFSVVFCFFFFVASSFSVVVVVRLLAAGIISGEVARARAADADADGWPIIIIVRPVVGWMDGWIVDAMDGSGGGQTLRE